MCLRCQKSGVDIMKAFKKDGRAVKETQGWIDSGGPCPVPGKIAPIGHKEFIEKLPQEEIARLLNTFYVNSTSS